MFFCVHTCVRDVQLGAVLIFFPSYFFISRQRCPFMALELNDSAVPAGQQVPGISPTFPHIPKLGFQLCTITSGFSCVRWKRKLRSSCLLQTLHRLSYHSSPRALSFELCVYSNSWHTPVYLNPGLLPSLRYLPGASRHLSFPSSFQGERKEDRDK